MENPHLDPRNPYLARNEEGFLLALKRFEIKKPEPVLTKINFVERYMQGEFGNGSCSWNSMDELLASGHKGLVHLRSRIVRGGRGFYNLTFDACAKLLEDEKKAGTPDDYFYISEMGPEHNKILNAEVMRSRRHLDLYYGTTNKTMRAAIADGDMKNVNGAVAERVLQHIMPTEDLDWLMYLLDTYEDHVVELSTYSGRWGTLMQHTAYWECRLY